MSKEQAHGRIIKLLLSKRSLQAVNNTRPHTPTKKTTNTKQVRIPASEENAR